MRQSDWKREYRRARCGATVDPAVQAVYRARRVGGWETCALIRAHWLTRPTMRAHKLSLIGDCRRALSASSPRLP
jgi:hypothetical protein